MVAETTNPLASDARWGVPPLRRRLVLPSWAGSVLFHILVAALILFSAQLPSCRRDISGSDGESFREVGIRMRPAAAEDRPQHTPQPQPETATAAPLEAPLSDPLESPPAPLNLPEFTEFPAVIGTGGRPPAPLANADSLVRPLPQGGGAPANAAAGGTTFLGIADTGRRFVFVIDRSASMEDFGVDALRPAKDELLASLARLNETQQFQVIFYNHTYFALEPRGGRSEFFHGTDAQRLQVGDQIRPIRAEGGTRHFEPLMAALKLRPDVIFLLTDGWEAALSSAELADLRRANRGGARIHCIELGRTPRSPLTDTGNFLRQLATQHDGKYTYRLIK